MTTEIYSEPVAALLTLGRPDPREKIDFQGYGITREHVPELIRLMLDLELRHLPWDEEGEPPPQVFAGIYAWRAIERLGAVEAIPALLDTLHFIDDEDDDWVQEEVPMVLARFGAPAVEPCRAYLLDSPQGLWARAAAVGALEEIGKAHPDQRDACVEALVECLKNYNDNPETLNAFLVSGLVELHAVEALPLIREAFAAEVVDLMLMGDIEDVEIELGVLSERKTPRPSYRDILLPRLPLLPKGTPPEAQPSHPTSGRKLEAKNKKRRKMTKQARRKNRKKKRK